MCDTIQGVRQVDTTGNGTNSAVPGASIPGPEGAGLDKALVNYANWFKAESLPGSELPMAGRFLMLCDLADRLDHVGGVLSRLRLTKRFRME